MNRRDRIDADADVKAVARGLGIKQDRGLEAAIRDVTLGRVERMLVEIQYIPTTIEELREAVHHHSGLHVVRITSEADLQAAQREFADELRGLPKQLAFEFGADTEALVLRRQKKDQRSNKRYLALVDARGEREKRAWFADWHESSHTLVPDPANNLVLRRTRRERPEPIEQVIDSVAGSLGFWEPIVKPILLANVATGTDLLDAFEKTRLELAPGASREASFRAFANFLPAPVMILWVDYDCRAEHRRSGQTMRSSALRTKVVIRNAAALAVGMNIPDNYRVPEHSVIATSSGKAFAISNTEKDDLGQWGDSSGRSLKRCSVRVTARGNWAAIQAA